MSSVLIICKAPNTSPRPGYVLTWPHYSVSVASNAPGEPAAAVAPEPRLTGLLARLYHHAAGAVRRVPRVTRSQDPVNTERVLPLPKTTQELSICSGPIIELYKTC